MRIPITWNTGAVTYCTRTRTFTVPARWDPYAPTVEVMEISYGFDPVSAVAWVCPWVTAVASPLLRT